MDYTRKMLYYTFVNEDRYIIFLRGFGNTLLLSIASFILGTMFGVLLCACKRSGNKSLVKIGNLITSILINIPTMVLLLAFVYVIFGSIHAPLTIIIIIALTMKTGAYICEIFNTSLDAVDVGEIEAARTLAMSKRQTFRYIIMPHVISTGLELYKNQFVICMQETAVVGYVAMVDLTRAASIVAARTMDAFFGLITITIIYFLIGYIAKNLLNLLQANEHIEV
ncbi:amino acid ABC transporter permease [Butyrivibrio sp. LC3010]|uniref:amino acid ABC transporter permease n=1 Tax=Butyrivibrio sp. LC3010 TaxID=1280680 RepID=UPI000420828B|nr:ABC transporter permease subunit [Butyrivibrio sp. LC3010]